MRRIVLATVIVAVSCVSCTDGEPRACGPALREALDPSTLVHVLPGAPPPSYVTNPPTSGAHQPTPAIVGAQSAPLEPQLQVGILEQGRIVVQYHGLNAADQKAISTLASDDVVTAPAPDLPGDTSIVATAWMTKMSCRSLDIDAIEDFARTRSGKAPGHP